MSPAKKGKSVPADLRKEYGAPFAIVSHKEGSRYTSLKSRDYTPPRCLDFRLIETLGWRNDVDAYCRRLGFENFVKMKHHGYQQLMLEFYTTFGFTGDDNDDGFHCRLMGKTVTVTRKTLCDIFGFREGGHRTVPKNFDSVGFWREISGGSAEIRNGRMIISFVKDPILRHMYKLISHAVFGRFDAGRVVAKNLFYLWCVYRDVRVCTPCFLIGAFGSVIRNKRANMCFGNLITAIAIYFGRFDPLSTDMEVLAMRDLGISTVKKRKCYKEATEEASSSDQADGEDTNPVAIDDQPAGPSTTPPAVDTWMLISRKLDKMQTRMNGGFNAMEARFDGLEKKVNAMRVRFKTFERKWVDLRQEGSNGTKTVEEMKQENIEANKSIEKLMLEKSESDKAAAIYKTRLEKLLPSIKKIEEGLSKISSMKVVDLASLVNDMRKLGTLEEGDNLGFPDSRGKTDGLGNRSMPDVNAEDEAVLLPGVRLASNSSGRRSKGLSKNGDRNSPQPWTIEAAAANTVQNSPGLQSDDNQPQPGSNECMEPLGSVAQASGTRIISGEEHLCKTTSSSSAAAGDIIIDILDSDNETKPNRAAEMSKRVLGSDVDENEIKFVRLSKRNRTERMGNLSAFSNTEWKKDMRTVDEDSALIHEKGNEVLKSSHDNVDCSPGRRCEEKALESQNCLNDEVFADSEDEALSDSRMEDLIASLREEKCVRKFTYEADMLRAFQQDEELCLNAVCALYRQTVSSRKSNGCLTLFKNGGFSPIDSMSGCTLAVYLIDEDMELRLTKSASEVKRQRPDVITQCRKLAAIYVGKLFEIYRAGDDPLFCQS